MVWWLKVASGEKIWVSAGKCQIGLLSHQTIAGKTPQKGGNLALPAPTGRISLVQAK
jgi:hypothetical protein